MNKLFAFLKDEEQAEFSFKEDDKGFNTVLNEHPEIKTLIERRDRYPETLMINGVNPVFHVMVEGIIENQLQSQAGVQEIFLKLQKDENLTPHAARACIASVFLPHLFTVLTEHQPFDQEAFVRRLSLIGTDISKFRRNDRCPCGSGTKFKRCCFPYSESFIVFPLAGRMDLGYGAYIFGTPKSIKDPLDPIFQLEARYHIAEYMSDHNDLVGAIKVLKENITQAEAYNGGNFLENAWQDYMLLCQKHEQLVPEFLEASDHLIAITDDDEEKGILICDKADFLAQKGNIEAAVANYEHLFDSIPKFYLCRYRYALMLSNNDREDDAIKVLTDLLNMKDIDDETYEEALALLEVLGGDTSGFEYLY